ncbi:MAG TPA: serine hydrolase [Longimicrobiales bacterium]|nr:serine hydrolase [Longimicrobiales bacterium]
MVQSGARRSFLAVAVLLLAASGSAHAQDRGPGPAELEAFDQYVARAVRDWNVPGLAIALVHGDSMIFARGYGVREVGRDARVDEHTRFAIGSTTKAMTTAALAMLIDEGKLEWDDRVIEHIPELRLYDPYATRELTVRDLLTHRTGLPGTDFYWGAAGYSLDEMIPRLEHVEPVASFRTQWNYQNVVYALAGELVERISGRPWHEFVRERIFVPLGMNETEPLDADILQKPNVVAPHGMRGDSVFVVPQRSVDNVASVGSVWSSVSDMSKWMRFMLDSARVNGRPLIQPETFREIVTPEVRAPLSIYSSLELVKPYALMYALGWFVHDFDGDIVWMHTGSINGLSAIVGLLPRHRFGVVVLVNRDHAELRHALMYRAFDLARGTVERDWSTDVQAFLEAEEPRRDVASAATPVPASLPLAAYAGTYVHPGYAELRVRLDGDALRVRVNDGPEVALAHQSHEAFRASGGGANYALVFDPDGLGNVTGVRMFGVLFRRVDTGR